MGTSRLSSNIKSVFDSIVDQFLWVKNISNEKFKNLVEKEMEKEKEKTFSFSKNLINEIKFKILSTNLSKKENLFIFLDSIDQLDPKNHNLDWLFINLPKKIKIIYSVINDHYEIYEKICKQISNENIYMINKIDKKNAKIQLNKLLNENLIKLNDKQEMLIEKLFNKIKNECDILHLNLIFKIVSKWNENDQIDEDFLNCINAEETIIYFFKSIEKSMRYKKKVFKQLLFYLTFFENKGISDSEIEGIVSLDNNVLNEIFEKDHPPIRRFPLSIWLMIKNEINDFLTIKEIDGIVVNAWYIFIFVFIKMTFLNINFNLLFTKIKKRNHRQLINASKNYIKLNNDVDNDESIQNIIDFFAETYKEKKSNGEKGKEKLFQVKEKILNKFNEIDYKIFEKFNSKYQNDYKCFIDGKIYLVNLT
jgi:hypothetical protein